MTAGVPGMLRRSLMAAWLSAMVLLPAALWQAWPDLDPAETSLLSLLPDAELSPFEKTLLQKISSASGNTLLIMLEPVDRPVSDQDILRLRTMLDETGMFGSIGVDPAVAARTAAALFPFRYHLLEQDTLRLLLADADEAGRHIVDARLRQLYSPAGMAGAGGLKDDPFGFFRGWLLSWLPAGIELREGTIPVEGGAVMLTATLRSSGFDLDTQFDLAGRMKAMQSDASARGQRLRFGGVPAFAAFNAVSARAEISTIGLGSTIGIVVLVLFAFSSLRPIFFSLIVIGSGIGGGAAASLLVFGHVHLLTWVFGASLLGIAIDYALHVMATGLGHRSWRPAEGVAHVFRPTALGLLSSLLGFATLLVTPFPVLTEIGTFATAGLSMAWLTCMVLAGPLLARWQPPLDSPAIKPAVWIARARNRLFARWPAAVVLVLICMPGLWQVSPDDRITALQAAGSPVAVDDAIIREHLPTRLASQFFVLEAPDADALLRLERTLLEHLAAVAPGTVPYGLSRLIAPADEQARALEALKQGLAASGEAARLFDSIGYHPELAAAELDRQSAAAAEILDPAALSTHLPPPWSLLWQGCADGPCRSVVLLDHIEDKAALARLDLDGVRFLDQVDLLSDRFAMIRGEAVRMLGIAIVLVAAVLAAIWGWRPALRITAVPCLGLLAAFAWLGYSGALYSVFNVFALLLVFGLGIDYAVFQHTSSGQTAADTARTELAILLSALTTLLAFGLLAASGTTVIAAFGSTLTAGIIACWMLSPLARPSGGTDDA